MIGYSSMAFHGFGNDWAGNWDVNSVLLFLSYIFALSLGLLFKKTDNIFFMFSWTFFACISIGCTALDIDDVNKFFQFSYPIASALSNFIVLYGGKRWVDVRPHNIKCVWAAALFLCISLVIWTLSTTSILCDSKSWFQGHALWHVLDSWTCGLLYLYLSSDGKKIEIMIIV